MSHASTTNAATLRFQAIFHAAVESYQKQTKNDLNTHPLASQLKSCDSTSAVLAILQEQVREFDKSRSGDERLTKWLSPTVNVLTAFSATVAGGVGLVSLDRSFSIHPLIFFIGIFSCERDFHRHWRLRSGKNHISFSGRIVLTLKVFYPRRPMMLQRVKTFSQNYLNASDVFSPDSKPIQRWHQLRQ